MIFPKWVTSVSNQFATYYIFPKWITSVSNHFATHYGFPKWATSVSNHFATHYGFPKWVTSVSNNLQHIMVSQSGLHLWIYLPKMLTSYPPAGVPCRSPFESFLNANDIEMGLLQRYCPFMDSMLASDASKLAKLINA